MLYNYDMDFIAYWNHFFTSSLGGWGSPTWWLIAACVVTVFFAKWARAIRTLLPFLGAFTLLFLLLWALTGLGVLTWHVPVS
jgi:hypothetical protein